MHSSRTDHPPTRPFAVLHDSPRLRVAHAAGDPARHVVAFAGIGLQLGGIPQAEWRRSLAGGSASVTYVVEKDRAWYNHAEAEVIDAVAPLLGGTVVTLGNSMGGFGAFHFAGLLPGVVRAIAFAPQYSVHPDHMPAAETRWPEYRDAIATHRIAHLLQRPAPHVRYLGLLGDAPREIAHARRIEAAGGDRVRLVVVRGGTHELAWDLSRAGRMLALLDLLLFPPRLDLPGILALLDAAGFPARLGTAG